MDDVDTDPVKIRNAFPSAYPAQKLLKSAHWIPFSYGRRLRSLLFRLISIPILTGLSNTRAATNPDLSSSELLESAPELFPFALAFEFGEEDNWRRDSKQKNND